MCHHFNQAPRHCYRKEAWHKRADAAWLCVYEVPRTDKFIAAESR